MFLEQLVKNNPWCLNINYFNAKVIKAFQHFCHGYYILLENLFKYLKNKINELILDPIFLLYSHFINPKLKVKKN